MVYKVPRGTADVLPSEQAYWRYVRESAEQMCRLYGYQRLDTPLFEDAGLFQRSIGEGTDIVEKETYDFQDRSGDLLTLRPEGTAPVCRAYLQHGMQNLPQPVKLYYIGPFFRYERPQAGRYRQFYQLGYEAIGSQDPAVDVEVIALAWRYYQALGLRELTILLNSIGDPQCRPRHLRALVEHYQPAAATLCRDCKVRLVKNPLRLLDCKEEQDQPIIQTAPRTLDYLCAECQEHFQEVTRGLELQGIPYRIEPRLVRGFDYYTKTVFEVVPKGAGAHGALGAGGRYDGLIEELGGKPTPAIGFAAGIERIVLNLKQQEVPVPDSVPPRVFVAHLGREAKAVAVRLADELRSAGISALLSFGERSLRAQLRHANSERARYAVILGEEEVSNGEVLLREMGEGTQERIPQQELIHRLAGLH